MKAEPSVDTLNEILALLDTLRPRLGTSLQGTSADGGQRGCDTFPVAFKTSKRDVLVWLGSSYSHTWVSNTHHTEGIAHLFIGLFHSGRIELQKRDTTVYGISTDRVTFNFYRIDKQSKWCSRTLPWGYTDNENKENIGLLLHIFSESSQQSPVDSRSNRSQWNSSLKHHGR